MWSLNIKSIVYVLELNKEVKIKDKGEKLMDFELSLLLYLLVCFICDILKLTPNFELSCSSWKNFIQSTARCSGRGYRWDLILIIAPCAVLNYILRLSSVISFCSLILPFQFRKYLIILNTNWEATTLRPNNLGGSIFLYHTHLR